MTIDCVLDLSEVTEVSLSKTPVELEKLMRDRYKNLLTK